MIPIQLNKLKKILVIKMRYIGDVVLTTPLLRALKQGIPDVRVDVLVSRNTHQVLENAPFADHVLVFDHEAARKSVFYTLRFMTRIRKERYDAVLDLTNNDRTALFTALSGAGLRTGYPEGPDIRTRLAYNRIIPSQLGTVHTVDHHLKIAATLGLPSAGFHPEIIPSSASVERIRHLLCDRGTGDIPFVIIHPGARRWYKSWPPERFSRLADYIAREFPVNIVLSGSPADRETCALIQSRMTARALNLAGDVSLSDLPALIREAVCLTGNDSAPIHIGTAVNTPVVALFGPTDPAAWKPRREQDRVLATEFPCRPCGHSKPDCPQGLGRNYCMSHINFETVRDSVSEVIARRLRENR